MKKDEIINQMCEEMPFELNKSIIPYIKEAMDIYAKEIMIQLVDDLKAYTHESHTILGHDEREPIEFVEIFLNKNKEL
jgi:hypothetical protein